MSSANTVTLVGNITRDPELRFTASGQAKTALGLAVNRRWQNRQTQEWEEATSFFNVVCWGEMGENVSECLSKGARVIVTGRLDQRSYETQEGERRTVVEVVADEIGPSLRWATAEIKKTIRTQNAQTYSGPENGGMRGNSGVPTSRAAAVPDGAQGYDYGEEPF
jgi:single-strand DNA-binding protein